MKITSVLVRLMLAVSFLQRLAHQPRLQAHLRLAHLALDLGLGRERRHRVHHDHVHRAGAHQHVGDLERLLAGVRLRDQQLVDVHAELLGVGGIERVLRVDEGGGAAHLLHFRDHLQGQRGLARGLGPVDLDHPAARQAAHAEGQVQAQRPGGDHLDVLDGLGVHPHDGALAVLLFDLRQRRRQCLRLVLVHLLYLFFWLSASSAGATGKGALGQHRILYKRSCIVGG